MVKTIDDYVKEAENIDKGIQLFKDGCKEEDVKTYIFKEKIIFYNHELIYFDSIKKMIEYRFPDGDCMLDYLKKHNKFPDRTIIFGDQDSKKA